MSQCIGNGPQIGQPVLSPCQCVWGGLGRDLVTSGHEQPEEIRTTMTVLALTIFVSTALVCFFLLLFVISIASGNEGPQDVLLPLQEDAPIQPEPATAKR